MQRFRDGLVFQAHELCVSLNSRLESNKEEKGEGLVGVKLCDRRCKIVQRFRFQLWSKTFSFAFGEQNKFSCGGKNIQLPSHINQLRSKTLAGVEQVKSGGRVLCEEVPRRARN